MNNIWVVPLNTVVRLIGNKVAKNTPCSLIHIIRSLLTYFLCENQ